MTGSRAPQPLKVGIKPLRSLLEQYVPPLRFPINPLIPLELLGNEVYQGESQASITRPFEIFFTQKDTTIADSVWCSRVTCGAELIGATLGRVTI